MGIPTTQEKHPYPLRCAQSPAKTEAGVEGLEAQALAPSPRLVSWLPWEMADQVYVLLASGKPGLWQAVSITL